MAYYATQDVQPITHGQAKKTHPTAGLGCGACAAAGMGAAPIVAVSGLGGDTAFCDLFKYVVLGAAAGAGVMYLGALATQSGSNAPRAKKFAKYGAAFGAAIGGLYFGGPAQQTAPVTTLEHLQPPVDTVTT